MVPCVQTVLSSSVAVAAIVATAACTPEEDPNPYVEVDTPIATDNGQFSISLRAAEGRAWPRYVGPTALAANIEVGPDPPHPSPQLHGDVLEPPLTLTLEPPWNVLDEAITDLTARTWPITPDGFKWMVSVDFTTPGDWVFPLTVRDARGRKDRAEIVFHIEPKP
ncbi:hypothetical protein OV079_03570 [Nannocystis pusilla]|uniref:Lipoprotein n=1 Tax=Nannocystis pusilla TaxID=889268 RepID=A0A9X3IU29_9BACT|nr:hypothetical protein [Nannocystis pusilla]MCY1004662.1 hypothetical protein [Nannocystis pusilla]